MLAAFVDLYDRVVLKHPLVSIALCLVFIAALATQLEKLIIDASADSLVLEGDEDLQYFRENSERYGSEEFLVITFQPRDDLLSDESLGAIDGLREELARIDGVSSVTSILDVPLLRSPPVSLSDITGSDPLPTLENPAVDRELVRQEFRDSPIYATLLVSEDGRTAAVQVNIRRDEVYEQLLKRRETLRAQKAAGELDEAGRQALHEAELDFKAYTAQANEKRSTLVAAVRSVVDGYRDQADLFVGGVPMIAADMISFVESDLVTFGAGIIVFIVLMLAIIFRSPRWVVVPLGTCVLTALFMLGLLATLDWRMTVISSNFVALLLIITLAIVIHLVVRFRELEMDRPEASQRELVLDTVRLMAVPCFFTAITTIVAFASLVVSGIRPVIDFGWMMTSGIAAALVLSFVLLPCSLALLPRGRAPDASHRHEGLTVVFARLTEKAGNLVIWVSLALLAFTVWGISRLEVENRFIDYFHHGTEIYQGMELLDAELGGTIPLDIVIRHVPEEFDEVVFTAQPGAGETVDGGAEAITDDLAGDFEDEFADEFEDEFEDDFDSGFDDVEGENFKQSYWFTRRGMEQVKAIHDYVDSLPETGKVLSLATTYDVVRDIVGEDVSDVELALVQKSLPEDIRQIIVAPYFSADREEIRISLRAMETSENLRRDQFLKNLRRHLVEEMDIEEENLELTNMLVLYNNVLQSLFRSQILTLGAVFIAITVMFTLLFRSLSLALIAVAPNILAAGLVLGCMGVVGIPLDIMTITIAAIVVGIGVDDTIHYVHRFKREFPQDRNYLATMYRCHESIGRAMYYTSLTVIVGFSILALSNFRPSIYFGLLTGLAMFVAVVGALMLLPQLIRVFKPLGPEGGQ
jgi:predicted RND superfamily exporter protein